MRTRGRSSRWFLPFGIGLLLFFASFVLLFGTEKLTGDVDMYMRVNSVLLPLAFVGVVRLSKSKHSKAQLASFVLACAGLGVWAVVLPLFFAWVSTGAPTR